MRGYLAVAALLVSSVAAADKLEFDPAHVYKVPRGTSPSNGPADAPITIVAWSDYSCGYCNRVQGTLDQLQRLYPGQIRWVHRMFALADEDIANLEAALAAGAQGKFRPMHDRLFAIYGRVDRAGVELIARELGLDMVKFRADLDTHAYRAQLEQDLADAEELGITGTPAFFINGRPVPGNQPLKVFADIVDEELARAAATKGGYAALVQGGLPSAESHEPRDAPDELSTKTRYRVGLGLPGRQLGPDDALVTVVAFSDFQCPFCAKQAPMLAHLREKYGDSVRIIFRDYPLQFHRYAELAAEAGVAAADQGKFWQFHDQVFGHFGHLTRADLDGFAKAVGLDMVAFDRALDTRSNHDVVVTEGAAAAALGVSATPTLFVNGAPVIGLPKAVDALDNIVDFHLKKVKQALDEGLPRADVYALIMSGAEGEDRADPSRIPVASEIHVELRAEERARAVDAACRRHDAARATSLVAPLDGDVRARVAAVCAGEGIDLPSR
ncbi:MAG TPA: thioredoxin domain-containing protein [Kofleriaceae bacterium]|jgi:protein-disulfide isomerase